jgi:hypothetical protein
VTVATVTDAGAVRVRTVVFGIAEAGAMVVTGVVMALVVLTSQVVRITQESAERRASRRAHHVVSTERAVS